MSFKKLLIALLLFITMVACKKSRTGNNGLSSDFKGKGGIYFLGSGDVPVNTADFANPNLAGVVIRFKWQSLETSPGTFNWSFIDGEISKAKANHKKVSMQILGYPWWIVTSLGAKTYNYIDRNPLHATYLDTLEAVVPFDNIYLGRIVNLINKFAEKYATDTTVAYFNLISGQISRGMPDSVITATGSKAFWTTLSYNADSLAAKMNALVDLYMSKFPNTPLWSSMDYVTFEMKASGRPINYLASQYAAYGISKYADRFGCWREDLAACNPPSTIATTNHWYILSENKTRTGAQMLWSVQDGPSRMNKCGIVPNTKQVVLDSSINNGLRLGMRYFEVYGADIQDATLSANIASYNNILKAKYAY